MIVQEGEFAILPDPAMGLVRKILIFIVLTAGIILIGRLAPRFIPSLSKKSSPKVVPNTSLTMDGLTDTTNALPPVEADTTGGRWYEKLFEPLERAYGLGDKSLKQKKGFWEIVLPKGKPIHEYALTIENICRANGISISEGVELRPANRSVEYHLESNGFHIKLRASLGNAFMAGSSRLAIVFISLDSLKETQLAALESADWDKSLVVNAYTPNEVVKKLRYTKPRNEILVELPMEPSSYPFVDPGKHALYIHHSQDDVEKILQENLDSLPNAAGFASRYGDRALENQPLLEKLFQFTTKKKLLFLDLTGSPRSLSRQTAALYGARNRSLTAFKDSVNIEMELARKAILAGKTGEAILVLPYTVTGFQNLEKALAANALRFNELGLELVKLSTLVASPESISTAPTKPAAPAKVLPKTEVKSPARKGAPAAKVRPSSKVPAKAVPASKSTPATKSNLAPKAKPQIKAKPATKSKTPVKSKPVVPKT